MHYTCFWQYWWPFNKMISNRNVAGSRTFNLMNLPPLSPWLPASFCLKRQRWSFVMLMPLFPKTGLHSFWLMTSRDIAFKNVSASPHPLMTAFFPTYNSEGSLTVRKTHLNFQISNAKWVSGWFSKLFVGHEVSLFSVWLACT